MADLVFHVLTQLRERLAEAVRHEQRVVAETGATAWRVEEPAGANAFERALLVTRPDRVQYAAKLCAAPLTGKVTQHAHQLLKIRDCVALWSRIVGRLDSRRAIERIDT